MTEKQINNQLNKLLKTKNLDYYSDLNLVRKAEGALIIGSDLVEEYSEALREAFLRAVGYQGFDCWFMAGSSTRCLAILKILESSKNE